MSLSLTADAETATVCAFSLPGDMANGLASLLSAFTDECKFRWTAEEMALTTTFVDPANVGMLDLSISLDTDLGVEAATVRGDGVTGVDIDWLAERLTWARIPAHYEDAVELRLNPVARKHTTRVERDVIRTSSVGSIDPAAMRSEPTIPDLDLPNFAEITPSELKQAVSAVDAIGSHVYIHAEEAGGGWDLHFSGDGGNKSEEVVLPDAATQDDVTDPEASSLFSLDYLKDISGALTRGKMGRATISWGEQFPTIITFTQSEWGVSGQFMLAPRIKESD